MPTNSDISTTVFFSSITTESVSRFRPKICRCHRPSRSKLPLSGLYQRPSSCSNGSDSYRNEELHAFTTPHRRQHPASKMWGKNDYGGVRLGETGVHSFPSRMDRSPQPLWGTRSPNSEITTIPTANQPSEILKKLYKKAQIPAFFKKDLYFIRKNAGIFTFTYLAINQSFTHISSTNMAFLHDKRAAFTR